MKTNETKTAACTCLERPSGRFAMYFAQDRAACAAQHQKQQEYTGHGLARILANRSIIVSKPASSDAAMPSSYASTPARPSSSLALTSSSSALTDANPLARVR